VRGAWYKLVASKIVTQYWFPVIAVWMLLAVILRLSAPAWKDIAADGDLSFLPASVPSAIGMRALEDAFPGSVTRSQMALVVANLEYELASADLALALDIARHLHWLAAQAAWTKLQTTTASAVVPATELDEQQLKAIDIALVEVVRDNLTEAIEIEGELSRFFEEAQRGDQFRRLPDTYRIRGELLTRLGEAEAAAIDLDTDKLLREQNTTLINEPLPAWYTAMRDVWTWRNAIVGHKLASADRRARLIAIQLDTEFTATGNIEILNGIEQLIEQLRGQYVDLLSAGVQVEVSGSAAIGADMLRAAASGVRLTEMVTIVLVLLILSLVYRAPFLVAIPLTSIALSLSVATSLIALLARNPADPDSWGLGVFTTTRIFIVVILFGAGTDFCLFFLARNRELLQTQRTTSRKQFLRVVGSGWRSVHAALLASALTTIVGLGLMWFSRFEKFQYSGPIIAISLAITLLVCLTFTPAMLSGIGRVAFWPLLGSSKDRLETPSGAIIQRYWERLAMAVTQRPQFALWGTAGLLAVPAMYGMSCLSSVTYDLTEELSNNSPSRRGQILIANFFEIVDSSPVTILVTREEPFESNESLRVACQELATRLYLDGVSSVRSLTDPLGDYPPGKRMGLFDQDAWRRRVLQGHRLTKERYVSSVNKHVQRVAKFDVILSDNPFSLEAAATLNRLREELQQEVARRDSPWSGAVLTSSGTTAGISDLRQVTQADQRRIQILVTLGVWGVLVLVLRKVVLSTYLIATVLLSYFATLGITYGLFSTLYAPDYSGLDWKLPLFLFVILVAVGQDYNVYLVTRIFEEQARGELQAGVRRALVLTGGIITSCGLVMAGTFIAMTSPAILHGLSGVLPAGWLVTDAPVLRGITELGFALAFGVLLDTLVVRSILVPAFVVLWQKRR